MLIITLHFDFEVKFKSTKLNVNADYCSRVPLPNLVNVVRPRTWNIVEKEEEFDEFDNFIIKQIQQLPTSAESIARETVKDPHLGKMFRLLESGQSLARAGYKSPELEYKLVGNCLVFEHRVVVPSRLRQVVLNDLHTAHLGVVKMKGIARSFVYWPGIDADIELIAKSCSDCARYAHAPPKYHDHHWEYPHGPWERIHIDYAGPFAGKMLLIVSDAYSKWLEVKITNSTTATFTIMMLDEVFAAYGVPITVVSDNGTQFTSVEFKEFLQQVGVKYHKRTAPYHPSTNGQAERNVQTVKDHLKIIATTPGTLQRNLNEFLRQHRKAPHSTTGQSPAQLFLGRPLRTRLDLLKPESLYTKITERQQATFEPSFRVFHPTQAVYFLSGNPRMDKWIPGTIISKLGDIHYEIDYLGKRFKRHVDQIRANQRDKIVLQPGQAKNDTSNRCITRDKWNPRLLTFPGTSSTSSKAMPKTPAMNETEPTVLVTRTKSPVREERISVGSNLPLIECTVTPDSNHHNKNTSVRSESSNYKGNNKNTSVRSEPSNHKAETLSIPRRSTRIHRPPQRFCSDFDHGTCSSDCT